MGDEFYSFEAYNYGPFSRDVYTDADMLAGQGLIEVDGSFGRSFRRYRLTPTGEQAAARVSTAVDGAGMAYLKQVVPWVQSVSFSELVRSIYNAYPEMRANSVFADRQ